MTTEPTKCAVQTEYTVVINIEEQYSVWRTTLPLPAGWREEGTTGSRDDCLGHIGRVWTDMRPKSVREYMDRTQSGQQ